MNDHQPADGCVIRPASFPDIPFIREIAFATWPLTYKTILKEEQLQYMLEMMYSPEALKKQMKNNHHFFLALKDYAPVGFASFSHLKDNIYKLQKLYVLPQQQRTSVGQTLLQYVETTAKNMGAEKIQLNVNRNNPATGFYKRNGYMIMKEEDIDIGEGYWMNDYVMEKKLKS